MVLLMSTVHTPSSRLICSDVSSQWQSTQYHDCLLLQSGSNINSASLSLLPYFQSLSWLTDATIVLAHIRGQVGAEEFHLPMSSTHEGFPSLWLVWLGEIQQEMGKDSSSRGPHCGVMHVAPTHSIPLQSPPVSRFWKLSTVLALILSRAPVPCF